MNRLQAVIFDMDGVIIDSEPIHYKVNQELYKKMEIEITEDEYNGFIGISNSDHWSYLKEKHSLVEDIEDLVARQNKGNIEHLKASDQEAIPGVVSLLEELKDKGVKIGLASSSSLEYIKAVTEKFAIKDYFLVMVSGENMDRGKPYPDIFLHAADKLNVDVANCVVIEDSKNGIKAARTAGMKCIGFINPNSGNQDMTLADTMVDSMEKITIGMLKGLFV